LLPKIEFFFFQLKKTIESFSVHCVASHLKEKDVIFFKRKPKKESPSVKEGGKGCQVFL